MKPLARDAFAAILFLPDSPKCNEFLTVEKIYLGHGNFDEEAGLTDECMRWCRDNLSYWELMPDAEMHFVNEDDAVRFMMRWW